MKYNLALNLNTFQKMMAPPFLNFTIKIMIKVCSFAFLYENFHLKLTLYKSKKDYKFLFIFKGRSFCFNLYGLQ